jgi:hypothetical protein
LRCLQNPEQLRFLLTSQSQYPAARALINNLYAGITASTADERAAGLEVVAAIAASVRMIVDESKKSTPVQVLVNCSDFHDRPTVDQLAIASEPVSRNFGSTLPAFMGNSAACFSFRMEKPARRGSTGLMTVRHVLEPVTTRNLHPSVARPRPRTQESPPDGGGRLIGMDCVPAVSLRRMSVD